MRTILSLACVCAACISLFGCPRSPKFANEQTASNTVKTKRAVQAYQLVWSDEFDGSAVNTANWTFESGGGGWGNQEQQYYQPNNASVANGNLVITARKQSVGGRVYTSARMITRAKREFTYGRVEARIKLPQGQGQWPAFWMLGANIATAPWPACGEIDIMENTNTSDRVLGTMHWSNNGHAQYGGNIATTPTSYHVYRIDWTPSGIRWFVDGVPFVTGNITNSINGTEEFHRPFFIILNLAIGGNLPGQTIDESRLPASMLVDYVRVYQLP